MTTQTTSKVKVSAKSLIDSPAFDRVSAWALIHNGKQAGKVLWTIGTSGHWKCSIIVYHGAIQLFGLTERGAYDNVLGGHVIGTAGGGGYDKCSASFADCLRNNGIDTPTDLSGRGTGAITDYLTGLGFTVIDVI